MNEYEYWWVEPICLVRASRTPIRTLSVLLKHLKIQAIHRTKTNGSPSISPIVVASTTYPRSVALLGFPSNIFLHLLLHRIHKWWSYPQISLKFHSYFSLEGSRLERFWFCLSLEFWAHSFRVVWLLEPENLIGKHELFFSWHCTFTFLDKWNCLICFSLNISDQATEQSKIFSWAWSSSTHLIHTFCSLCQTWVFRIVNPKHLWQAYVFISYYFMMSNFDLFIRFECLDWIAPTLADKHPKHWHTFASYLLFPP